MTEAEHWIFVCDIDWDVPVAEVDPLFGENVLSSLPDRALLGVSEAQVLDYFASEEEWLVEYVSGHSGWAINSLRHKYVGPVTNEDPQEVMERLLFEVCPDEPEFDLGIDWKP